MPFTDVKTSPPRNKQVIRPYRRSARQIMEKVHNRSRLSISKKKKGDRLPARLASENRDAEPMSDYLCLSRVCFSTATLDSFLETSQTNRMQEQKKQEKDRAASLSVNAIKENSDEDDDEAVIHRSDSDATLVACGSGRPGLWTVVYPTERRPSPTCEARERMKCWSFEISNSSIAICDDEEKEEEDDDDEEEETLVHIPTIKDEVGDYIGERNTRGQPHGHGVCVSHGSFVFPRQVDGELPETRLVYEGHWVDGKRNGSGVCQWDGNFVPMDLTTPVMARYDGEWRNDQMHGRGRCQWSDGSRYIGQFSNDEMDGHGYIVWDEGRQDEDDEDDDENAGNQETKSEAKEQRAVARRESTGDAGDVDERTIRWYDGTFRRGQMHGRGVLSSGMEGSRYEGQFAHGKKHGHGTFTMENGEVYVGHFRDDLKCGRGTYTWPDGSRYLGEWKDDWPTGDGVWYGPRGERFQVNVEKAASTFLACQAKNKQMVLRRSA